MRYLCICLSLLTILAISESGLARNWAPMGEGGDGQFLLFVDLDSVEKVGPYVHVWERHSYIRPVRYTGGRLIHMIKSSQSYDCRRRSRLLLNGFAYSDHEGRNAIGAIRYNDVPEHYETVPPDSSEEKIMNLVCKTATAIERSHQTSTLAVE